MSSADILRQLADPSTVTALADGAAALDQVPQLEATIAGLQTSNGLLADQLKKARPVAYTVAAGDTLSGVAKKLGLADWHALQTWNGLTSTTIKAGQQLLAVVSTDPPPPALATVFGINPGSYTVAQRVQQFGAVPKMKLFSLADVAGTVPGKRAQVCKPWNQADLAAGKFDAAIATYIEAQLTAGVELLLITDWQEPDGELSGGTFTVDEYRAANLRLSQVIQAHGEKGRVMLSQCLIAPQKRTGMAAHPEWVLTPDLVGGIDWARLTLDNYGNPARAKSYGNDPYATPYPNQDDVLVDAIDFVHATGYDDNWAVSEFNSPWRIHWKNPDTGVVGDPDHAGRLGYLDGYVRKLVGLPKPPQHIDLWEGHGSKFDQTFTVQSEWDWWKSWVAQSA